MADSIPPARERGALVNTPVQAIENALSAFTFAVRISDLMSLVEAHTIEWRRVGIYTSVVPLPDEQVRISAPPARYTEDELDAVTRNLLYITAGTLAAVVFEAAAIDCRMRADLGSREKKGKKRKKKAREGKKVADYTDTERAIEIICQIRNAFAHGPHLPRWHVSDDGRKNRYRLTVSGIDIDINFATLHGREVTPEHHGGWEGFVAMTMHLLAKVKEHAAQLPPGETYERYVVQNR